MRADIVRRAKRSKVHGRMSLGLVVQIGVKTRTKWETTWLNVIAALCAFTKTTVPMTKRDVAAHLGCSVRTADTTISRMLADKLIGRKRKPGSHGWCYFSADTMVESAPDQEEEEAGEEPENEEENEGEQTANVAFESDPVESETYKEDMRKPLRMFDSPRLLFPGRESAPVSIPEGVQIRSVRVAETAESDVSLSWSDAVIDEQGEITVWVHGCRKKNPAPPHVESTPKATDACDRNELRSKVNAKLKPRNRPDDQIWTQVCRELADTPNADYLTKFYERVEVYNVKPPLLVIFAKEVASTWSEEKATREQAASVSAENEARLYEDMLRGVRRSMDLLAETPDDEFLKELLSGYSDDVKAAARALPSNAEVSP